jgi:quercetin dioxygenase-like cupin family protein
MEIFRHAAGPMRPADAATFAGTAHTKLLASSEQEPAVHLYRVEFGEGGRTNWHTHSGPQWLFVLDGRVRVQTWNGEAHEVVAGDAVLFPPGEKHWHGAAPGSRGSHLAINVNVQTTWLEPVSDEQFRGAL